MLEFRLAKEISGTRTIVEIWLKKESGDDILIGCIYPHEQCITITSKYYDRTEFFVCVVPLVKIVFDIARTEEGIGG